MNKIAVSDSVLITVKRIELVAQVLKIENDMATCSFYMPRSKGMSTVKVPLEKLKKVEQK